MYFCLLVVVVVVIIVVVAVVVFIFSYLFKPSNCIITIIITIMFINITVMSVLEKSSGESSKQGIQAAWSTPVYHVK